jgi:hypothetical protein
VPEKKIKELYDRNSPGSAADLSNSEQLSDEVALKNIKNPTPEMAMEFISESRAVLQCAKEISAFATKISGIDDELAQVGEMYDQTNRHLKAIPVGEDRFKQLEVLQMCKIIERERIARCARLIQKLNQAKEDITFPRQIFWHDLEEVLVRCDLAHETPEVVDSDLIEEAEQTQRYHKTTSSQKQGPTHSHKTKETILIDRHGRRSCSRMQHYKKRAPK